ncbi:MAG: hypothetical protein KTU85_00505 [Acidimicrobiia bacterium]|nr:hypothetical protein [Acidimicrobiia bacterium]MCY4457892.1 hypothetical protein [Acidimicrobiaceae bacterium]
MTGITVTRRDGILLACKSMQVEDADRLRHEAQLLQRLEHPGIVQFVELVEGENVELYLAFVSPDSWSTTPPTNSAEIIESLASLTSTVADLHNLGTAHGALRPEHVLVAPDKRPILCGLGDATAATDASCASDLEGIAKLIEHLATNCTDKERKRLASIARNAEQGIATAREITVELNRLHGGTQQQTGRLPQATSLLPATLLTSPKRLTAVVAVVLVLGVLGLLWLRPSGSPSGPEFSTSLPAGTVPSSTTISLSSAAPSTNSTTSSVRVSVPALTPKGQSAAAEADRLIVQHQGRRYGVGQKGDVAILGDWSCDGEVTLALLQRTTGTVAVFATWPAPNEQLAAGYVTVVEGATGLRNDPTQGCDQLRVTHQTGSTLIETEFS